MATCATKWHERSIDPARPLNRIRLKCLIGTTWVSYTLFPLPKALPYHTSSWLKLRPPGGSITVFSTRFNKVVWLSYAFTLDPYNPILTGSTIIKNYCHYLQYKWFTPLVPLNGNLFCSKWSASMLEKFNSRGYSLDLLSWQFRWMYWVVGNRMKWGRYQWVAYSPKEIGINR